MDRKDNKEQWIEAMRRKVVSNEVPVEESNWNDIMASLAQREATKHPVVTNGHRRQWTVLWSVAATVAIVALMCAYILFDTPTAVETSLAPQPIATVDDKVEVPESSTADIAETPLLADRGSKTRPMAKHSVNVVSAAVSHSGDDVAVQNVAATAVVDNVERQSQTSVGDSLSQRATEQSQRYESMDEPIILASVGRHEHGSVSVYGSGMVSENNGNQTAMMAMSAPSMMMNMPSQKNSVTAENISYQYQHKMPITVGASFNKRIGCNIDLSVGVNYTLLRSDVFSELPNKKFEQRLQFIGIPVGANWNFVKYKRLEAYVGGSVQMERCVDARFDDEKIDIKQLQWSAHAQLGVRLKIIDHLSIYAEPKVSHYFNELPLVTIRNEHPLNFNLHLGVSFDY